MSPWISVGLAVAGAALAAANGLTTRRLWSSAAFDGPQKVAQTALIWLLPGSFVVVRHFLGEPERESDGDPTVFKDYSERHPG
jgi:drug/metabolite transporter (DMT)-like permease